MNSYKYTVYSGSLNIGVVKFGDHPQSTSIGIYCALYMQVSFRTYCKQCVALYGSEDILKSIEECDPWSCFLCEKQTDYMIDKLLIRPRDDWRQRLMRCYQKPSKLHNVSLN